MFQLQQGPVLAATGHQLCNPVAVLLSAQHPVSDAGESITPSTGTLLDTEMLAELSSTDVFDSETIGFDAKRSVNRDLSYPFLRLCVPSSLLAVSF